MRPTLQALVLADQVYVDAASGKKIIAGTFNILRTGEFPTTFARSTFAYINLTNIRQRTELELRYVDLEDNRVLMRSPRIEVQSPDPLQGVELVVELPPFPMPHAGTYAFEAHADDELVGSLRITVAKRRQP